MLGSQMPINLNNTQQIPMTMLSDAQTPIDYQQMQGGGFE
jgi:hypothetical protein